MTRAVTFDEDDRFIRDGKMPPMGKEDGSSFGWYDRMFFGWQDGKVFDYSDWEARDLETFLKKDYKGRQILNVLQLPISSATYTMTPAKGDAGEFDWLQAKWEADPVNGGCKTPLNSIIDQATTAIAYKKAYFEKVFRTDDDGSVFYDKVAFRPQTTCRMLRDPKNAKFTGFEQEAFYVGPEISKGHWPIVIPPERAYVHIHGQRWDPLNGTSDMEVPYWCYKTKQKIMLLWFQFLEGVALPRQIVKANDVTVAQQVAGQLARLKNSGILPVGVPGGTNSVDIASLDISGKGAEQFVTAISWLDGSAVDSVLAGFLNLTGTAAARGFGTTGGSYALSKDASDFFLQALETKTTELAHSLRRGLFAPIVRYNFGKKAAVPQFTFEPLNDEDKTSLIALLQAMITASAAPGGSSPVPPEFVSELARQVADYLGMDGDKISTAFQQAAAEAKQRAAQMGPAGASPIGQQVAGVTGATDAATAMVGAAQADQARRAAPAQPPKAITP